MNKKVNKLLNRNHRIEKRRRLSMKSFLQISDHENKFIKMLLKALFTALFHSN